MASADKVYAFATGSLSVHMPTQKPLPSWAKPSRYRKVILTHWIAQTRFTAAYSVRGAIQMLGGKP